MEQLITFETAKLAKEKGFDEFYMNCYDLKGQVIPLFQQTSKIEQVFCSAPTQEVLSKWIRENFKYHISTNVEKINKKEVWRFKYWEFSGSMNISWESGFIYKSHEEALEAGLFRILEVIKSNDKTI